ncbi:MAG: hypothetical protein KDA80_11950 [Planctomycetaceae bacterium]|nr:hypothetical protein [Planctomycetaceae bacterium]
MPIQKAQLGPLSVAVFENSRESDAAPVRSVSIAKRYFDRSAEEWKTTSVSLNPADVPAVIELMKSIQSWLISIPEVNRPGESDR